MHSSKKRCLATLACVCLTLSCSTISAFGAEYDTPPQLTFSTKGEIADVTYSNIGKWENGLTKYMEFSDKKYTFYPEAIRSGQKGIPVVVTVDDPDKGQVLKGKVQVQSRTYNIAWGSLSGRTLAPTGKRAVGYVFVPISDLSTGAATITVTVQNFENASDATPLSTRSDSVSFKVDRTAPLVSMTRNTNKIIVNSCNELPARLHVEHQDAKGTWLPDETYRIVGVPSTYEYDSLVHEGTKVRYWVSDMVGNETTKESGSLAVSTNKVEYTGFSEENRSCYAVFVGIRLGEEAKTLPEYYTFIGSGA